MPTSSCVADASAHEAVSLADSLHWTRFRTEFATAVAVRLPLIHPPRVVDRHALSRAFWSWAALLEHDASFEALDPVDYAHFAAGQLLARLLMNRPIVQPPLSPEAETSVLVAAVLGHLQSWRRAHGGPALDGLPVDTASAHWASFLENTAHEPELAVAFLDQFTGREPVWRYPQIISERPAMRRARHPERDADG